MSEVKKGAFYCTRFSIKNWNVKRLWQLLIVVPITLIIDICIWLYKLISKVIKNILIETKKLTFKLAYELLKALLKPFAILLSIFGFCIIIYSLIKDITVIQTVNIIFNKLF